MAKGGSPGREALEEGWEMVISGLTSSSTHTPLLPGGEAEQRNGLFCSREMILKKGTGDREHLVSTLCEPGAQLTDPFHAHHFT